MPQPETVLAAIEAMPIGDTSRQLRGLLPAIDRRIADGVSHQEIVALLANHGLNISVPTLRKRLYRWRKANQPSASSAAPATPRLDPAPVHGLQPPGRIRNRADLANLRTTEIDLDTLAQLGKSKE
ncbi:hypothetical protein IMZ29_07120 [Achromobacter sp. GG226]|uniref:hypothetical protein n=1 Tax=Verticiella alkaliphila TaxID=2779529 RepID=UPI001C0C302D|nr:hypothetical protein [Verticiella sp. GG226]MBU4610318.1 hypothetical protein [Verticiella sp. GG226]